MTFLIDLDGIPDACCTDALEELAKASRFGQIGHLGDPVPNRFARPYVEAISGRLLAIVGQMEAALAHFLGRTLTKAIPWERMDGAKFEATRAYLESKAPDRLTVDDYRLLIEWLIARYLPEDVALTEGEYIGVVGVLMGKVQSNIEMDHRIEDPMIATLATLVPTTFAAVPIRSMTPIELAIMNYTKAHAAEYIRGIAEQTRHRMASVILQHQQAALLGQREGGWRYLATALFDTFSAINADMRRIAVTEGGEAVNQGYIAAKTFGQKVKRIEAYRGACQFCQSINGLILEVVSPDATNKNGWTQTWAGKSNFGRSASSHKRVGGALVQREESELWWPASGVMHPNCRGSWTAVTDRPAEVSVEFFDFAQRLLDSAG